MEISEKQQLLKRKNAELLFFHFRLSLETSFAGCWQFRQVAHVPICREYEFIAVFSDRENLGRNIPIEQAYLTFIIMMETPLILPQNNWNSRDAINCI